MKELFVTYLNSSELETIAAAILEYAEPVIKNHELMVISRGEIQKALITMNELKTLSRTSKYTAPLKGLDDVRDNYFQGLKKYLAAMAQVGTKEQVEAALTLSGYIESIGAELHKDLYPVESEKLRQLFQLFNSEKGQEAVNVVNASQIVANLISSEAEFDKLYQEKIAAENDDSNYPEAAKAKSVIKEHLQLLLGMFSLLELKGGNDAIVEPFNKINELIEDIMRTARARKTRKENKKNTEQE